MKIYTLSHSDMLKLIDRAEIIEAVRAGFISFAKNETVIPPVIGLDIEENRGEVHVKSCHIKGQDNYCIKIASGFYNNAALGLPTGNGMMTLFNAKTGALSALLFDQGLLTDLRTGAAGAIATQYCAIDEEISAGVIGAGVQARMQIEFLLTVRFVKEIYIWDIRSEAVDEYIKDMQSRVQGAKIIRSSSPVDVAVNSNVLITTTPAREPIIYADMLKPGLHITAMGSDGPGKQEIDAKVFKYTHKIIADKKDQCLKLGEIHHAVEAGVIKPENIYAELGEIAAGFKPGRENDEEITLCDLTGVGFQDTAVANWALKKAKSLGLGKYIEV